MNCKKTMIVIKGEIKTSQIVSCKYNTVSKKWDVKYENGKIYSYAYSNVEVLKEPKNLNPKLYKVGREGRELFDIEGIYAFEGARESYWHICFCNGSERDYRKHDLEIVESCFSEHQAVNVFEYLKQFESEYTI